MLYTMAFKRKLLEDLLDIDFLICLVLKCVLYVCFYLVSSIDRGRLSLGVLHATKSTSSFDFLLFDILI